MQPRAVSGHVYTAHVVSCLLAACCICRVYVRVLRRNPGCGEGRGGLWRFARLPRAATQAGQDFPHGHENAVITSRPLSH